MSGRCPNCMEHVDVQPVAVGDGIAAVVAHEKDAREKDSLFLWFAAMLRGYCSRKCAGLPALEVKNV